jgi:hypothetical protein
MDTAAQTVVALPQASGGGLLPCIPYLLIVAAGIVYGLASRNVEAAAPLAAAVDCPRPPSGVASAVAASVVAAAPAPSDAQNEALKLVYEYRLPGTNQDMLDLVGAREGILGPFPWEIECDESNRCDVSFISRVRGEEEPVYKFAVDLGAKAVTPSPSTAERLLSEVG